MGRRRGANARPWHGRAVSLLPGPIVCQVVCVKSKSIVNIYKKTWENGSVRASNPLAVCKTLAGRPWTNWLLHRLCPLSGALRVAGAFNLAILLD